MNRSEIKQEAIMVSARSLFITKGYQATTMQMIAEKANVSKRTLYKYCPNKASAFEQVINVMAALTTQRATLPFTLNQPIEKQLEYILRGKIDMLQNEHYRQLARVSLPLGLTGHDVFKQVLQGTVYQGGPLINWLNEVKAEGLLRDNDTDFIGNLIQGMLETTVFWPQLLYLKEEPSEQKIEKLIQTIADVFMFQFVRDNTAEL